MSNIKSIDQLNMDAAANNVAHALMDYPAFMVFASSKKGGFVMLNAATPEDDIHLRERIIIGLKQYPELLKFLKDVISKL